MSILTDIAKSLPAGRAFVFPVDGRRNYLFEEGRCLIQVGDTRTAVTSRGKQAKLLIDQDRDLGVFDRLQEWADEHKERAENGETKDSPEDVAVHSD